MNLKQAHKNAQIDNKKRIKVFDGRGTKAWADVPDATKWLEELRGNDTPEVTPEVPCKPDVDNSAHEAEDVHGKVDNVYTKNDTTAGVLRKEQT